MQVADRQARLERAKAIGRVAYRLVRDEPICAFIELDGQRKRVQELRRGFLFVQLYSAAGRPPCDTDWSQLRITYTGGKVLVIRWSVAGAFKVVTFEPGDWSVTLRELFDRV